MLLERFTCEVRILFVRQRLGFDAVLWSCGPNVDRPLSMVNQEAMYVSATTSHLLSPVPCCACLLPCMYCID